MTAAELCHALVRTTLAAGAAACLAALLLAWLRISSPRIHRAAWALVIVQGWLLIPWTLKLEAPAPQAPTLQFEVQGVSDADSAFQVAPSSSASKSPPPIVLAPAPPPVAPLTIVVWLGGVAMLTLAAGWRYVRIVRTLPLGATPDDPGWRREWRRVQWGAMASSARKCSPKVHLRITDRLGPLVAFIPFTYLLLAPRPLWIALTPAERTAILRHELAHVRRRDLWKSLALRLLALPQWFNPLVWLAIRRFDEAAEWACDAAAARGLAQGPTTVAGALLRTAELTAACTPPPRAAHVLPAVPGACRAAALSRRIHRLVTPRSKEESIMRRLIVPTLLTAIAAAQLIRIERVAADATPPPSQGESRGGIEDAAEVVAASHDAPAAGAARRKEYKEAAWPRYVIEPPDILLIEGVKLVPKPPYRIETFDVILVRVLGAFPEQPIDDAYSVDADGTINLGPQYGRIKVAGLTMDDAEAHLREELAKILSEVEVSASLVKSAGFQAISDQHLVAMDGRVNLGVYGSVFVAGMTIEQARDAIEQALSDRLEGPQVSVDVLAYNSKAYYVIVKGDPGDNVTRMPVTGNETVLDAVANLGGISRVDDAKVWIARPAPNGVGAEQILQVDWHDIADGVSTDTNYQLMPGDRLFIESQEARKSRTTREAAATSVAPPEQVSEAPPMPDRYYDPANPAIPRRETPIRSAYSSRYDSQSASAKLTPLEFQISFVEDRSGDLADFDGMRESGMSIGDATTTLAALRVFRKHELIKTLADPTIRTEIGRAAGIKFAEPAPAAGGDGADFRVTREVTVLAHAVSAEGRVRRIRVELAARALARQIDVGIALREGQAAIVKLIAPPNADPKAPDVYVVVTPKWLD